METKNDLNSRPISNEPYSLRPYADNCDEIAVLCEKTGQKPAELLRQLVDEALIARRSPSITDALRSVVEQNRQLIEQNQLLIEQNRKATERGERLSEKLESLDGRWEALKRGLTQELRQFYAILVEALTASIGARRLVWKYVAHTVLKESGFKEQLIEEVYAEEQRACIGEREITVETIERSVREM